MAQDKRVFTGGMDKDSDPRLIKNGDYRDALNIRNISSSDSTSGSVENIEGNTIVPNQKFIDEETQVIEVTPIDGGNSEIIELESNQTFQSQKLIFTNKESAGAPYSHKLYYLDGTTNIFVAIGDTYNWIGNVDQKKTSQILYEMFGPGSPLSSFTIPDITTGNSITIQAELDFEENTALSGNIFTVTLKTTQAGSEFLFQAYGGQLGINAGGESLAIASNNFSIGDTETLGDGIQVDYEVSFDSVVGVDTNVDDDDVVFGGATPIPVGATEYELSIEGVQPTDNSIEPENNVNIFSWTQVGEGDSPDDYLVETFLDLDEIKNNFGSGGDFAFDANQDSFSQAFTDAISEDKFNHVLIDGGAGSTTTVGLIKTDFSSNTKLEGINSGGARNNSGSVAYSQLEYYYNNTEVVEGDGFSISEGTLTFSGEDVLADNSYILKSPIIRNKSYKILFTVNGLEAIGKSFTLKSGNTDIGTSNSNGSNEFLFTSSGNSSVIYLSFDSNFSASDSFTITNLRLFLEDVPVSKLSIKLACLNTFKFNLAFAASESELRDSLSGGNYDNKIDIWYPGTSIELVNRSFGGGETGPTGVDLSELQASLLEAQETIVGLELEITNLNSDHTAALAELQTKLDLATDDAAQIAIELDAAVAANTALATNLGQIYTSYTTLVNTTNDLTGGLITAQSNVTALALSQINEALTAYSDSVTSTNSELAQQVESLTQENTLLNQQLDDIALQLSDTDEAVVNISDAISQLQSDLDRANIRINELNDNIAAITPEDGITQADVDAVQALLDAVVPEDGITQANVDAVEQQLADAIKAAEDAAEAAAAALLEAQDNSVTDAEEIDRLQGLLDDANEEVSIQEGLVNTAALALNAQIEANGTLDDLNTQLEAEVADLQLVILENGLSQADVDAAVAAANVISAEALAALQDDLDTAEANNGVSDATIASLETELDSVKLQAANALIAQASDIETIFLESQDTISNLTTNYNNQKIKLEEVKTESLSSDVSTRISEQIGILNSQVGLISDYNASKPTTIDTVNNDNDFSDSLSSNLIVRRGQIDYNNPIGADITHTGGNAILVFNNLSRIIPNSKTVTINFQFSTLGLYSIYTLYVIRRAEDGTIYYNRIHLSNNSTSYQIGNTNSHTVTFNSGAEGFDEILLYKTADGADVISKFNVSYVGLSVTTTDIIDISTLFSSLATGNLSLNNDALIDALDENHQADIEILNANVVNYTTTLGALHDNLSSLQIATQASINELGIISSISQADIDEAVLNFNSDEFTLTQQIQSLSDLVTLLTQQIDSLEPRGNKWLFTLSGGAPVEKSIDFSDTKYQNLYLRITNSNTDYTPSINALGGDLSGSINLNLSRATTGYSDGREQAKVGVGSNQFLTSGSDLVSFTSDLSKYEGITIIDEDFQNISSGDVMQSPISFKPTFVDSEGNTVQLDITLLNYDISNLIAFAPYTSGTQYIAVNRGNVNLTRETSYLTNEGIDNGYQFTVQDVNEVGGWEFSIVDFQGNSLKEFSNIQQESFGILVDSNEDYSWNFSNVNHISYSTSANYQLHFEQIEVEDNSETENNNSAQSRSSSVESFVSRASLPSYSMASVKPSEALIYPSRSSDIILNKSRDRAPNLSSYNLGAKKYIKNTLLQKTIVKSNLSSEYSCIGTYEDKPKNSIYYLVHDNSSNHYDCILEYSLIDDKVRTVYQDGRVGSDGLTENILNFSNDKAITGVNKIDDILYWTDDLNRPRKINVELAKKNEVNIDNALKFEEIYYNGSSSSAFISYNDSSLKNDFRIGDVIYTQAISGGPTSYNGYAKVTGIVRKMGSSVKFSTTNNSNQVTSSSDLSNILDPGEFIGIMFNNFPYYYQVESISGTTITTVQPVVFTVNDTSPLSLPNGNNAGALLTDCPFLESFSELPGILMFADPSDSYSPLISFGGYEDKMRYLDVIKHQPYNRPSITPETDSSYKHNNILDNLFQFKYRYVHHDNENTSYSGISDVIIDDEFARNTPLKFSEYSKTANNLKVGYVDAISDVKKIEIVARKGNDGEFFLVDTVQNNFIKYLKVLKNELIIVPEFYFDVTLSKINFKNNGVYPFVDKAESDKLFDAVPKLAKAQTIISDNRLTYGNILEGYDNTPLVMRSSFETDGKPKIETTESSLLVYGNKTSTSASDIITDLIATGASAANTVVATELTGTSEPNIWESGGGKNCKMHFYIDFDGMDLNDENSQHLDIDIGFEVHRRSSVVDLIDGKSKKRAARFAMNIDITGFDSINQVRNEIISQFEANNWEGGTRMHDGDPGEANMEDCSKDEGGESQIQCSLSGATRIDVYWKQKDNKDDPNGAGADSWGDWERVKQKAKVKFLSGAPGISSFKTGAFHDFGIAYFDETNRCSFVNTSPDFGNVPLQDEFEDEEVPVNLNGTRLYNKFPTEIGPELGQSSGVKFEIYNRPPKWATSYQFVYAGNTSVDEFMQVTIPHVIPGSGGGDTQMYLSLQSLKNHKSSYTESTSSLVDFDVADGDRIRFISCKIGNERKRFTTYLDFEITGFDVYQSDTPAGEDTQPITTGAGEGGFYITMPNPGSQTVELDDGSTVSLNHSGFSLDGSGYDLLIAEIYRPRKTQSPENLVYNEIGDRYAIGNAGTSQRYHNGDTAQNPDYFISKEVNTEVSLVPAVIRIDSGDVYMKARTMFTIKDGSTFESFACEDYFLNDFHNTNHYDRGRINVINTNAAERRLDTSVYYSETYSSTGSINGLSSFNLANVPYFDYNKEFGSIQSLKNSDNDLIIFHESKVGRVLVKSDILNTASGTGLVSLSNEVISNYANLYSGQFGCGLNPESIVRHGKKFYFADIKRGAVLRLSADGLTVISDYGMKDYFRDIGEMYIKYNPDKIKTFEDSDVDKDGSPYLLIGGYDPKYDEYVLTIPTIESPRGAYNSGNSSNANKWSESISNWDNVTSLVNLSTDETIFNAVTLAFSEGTNRWTSFYSFIPEFYSKINKQFVSFKQGRIYRHNDSDVYSRGNSDFNKFYGHNNLSYIDFVFNAEPSSVKTYNAIGLESDTKFITGMFTNMGQYYGNYDDVITTSISFKKVDGTIYLDGSNKIVGTNTRFYESVSPGDLVRVFGYIKRDYLGKDFIVSKVISNNLIEVNEPTQMKVKNSYMLVIDYKSKEGIQYSDIPFAGSSYDSMLDENQFGDGSEIQGVGSASSVSELNNNVTLTGSLLNVVDINNTMNSIDMISGAEYAIFSISNNSNFNVLYSDNSLQTSDNYVGSVFKYNFTQIPTGEVKVIPTTYKLYLKQTDNKTVFLGYIYASSTTSLSFLKSPNYNDVDPTKGFLFVVKSGSVEGERMKGSYMRTILATNSQQSKSKFNLYAANADIDKSELSNR
jgi:hypothetical protein